MANLSYNIFGPQSGSAVPQPSGFSSTTDWTSTNGLPARSVALWVGITPGSTCSIKIDGGGQTGLVFNNVSAGFWPIPVIGITKIYAVGNGSTGASNLVVIG